MKIYQYLFLDYIVKVKLDNQDVNIYITDGQNLWNSNQSIESSKPQLSFLKKYKANIEEALANEHPEKYELQFDEEKKLLYIMILENEKKFIVSTFQFEKIQDKKQVMKMFNYYINKISKLETKNEELEEIAKKKQQADEVAKKAVEEKLLQENTYLTAFIHILNEKKQKISLLEKELQDCYHPKPKRTPKRPPRRIEEMSEEEQLEELMR